MPPVFSRETPRVSVQDASHAGQGRTSPCECRCPAGNPIQKMERAIADGNEALALEYLRARNPFPGVTYAPIPAKPAATGIRTMKAWQSARWNGMPRITVPPSGA